MGIVIIGLLILGALLIAKIGQNHLDSLDLRISFVLETISTPVTLFNIRIPISNLKLATQKLRQLGFDFDVRLENELIVLAVSYNGRVNGVPANFSRSFALFPVDSPVGTKQDVKLFEPVGLHAIVEVVK